MKKFFVLMILLLMFVSCGEGDSGDTGNTGDTGDTDSQIVGKWIGFFDEVITGPNDALCNSIYFDIDNEGNIKILSFLDGNPAAGHKGTYTFEENELLLSLTHDWAENQNNEPFLNWVEAPWEAPGYAEVSGDGEVLSAGPSEAEAWEVNKIELSDPDSVFIGDWVDDVTDGSFKISSPANYEYEETGYNESGIVKQFTYIDDAVYLLSNTTYSSSVNGGASCDVYYVGLVTFNETKDEMTIKYGDDEIVYSLSEE